MITPTTYHYLHTDFVFILKNNYSNNKNIADGEFIDSASQLNNIFSLLLLFLLFIVIYYLTNSINNNTNNI